MANTLLTIDTVLSTMMMLVENNLSFTKTVQRRLGSEFGRPGQMIGDAVTIRVPPLSQGRTGRVVNIESLADQSITLTLSPMFGVDRSFTSEDLTLNISDFATRFLASDAATIANKIDMDGMKLAQQVSNFKGTAGTTPSTLLVYSQAMEVLDYEGVPRDDRRFCVINPAANTLIVDALKGLFHESVEVARQYKEGNMGRVAGMNWSMDQNAYVHTVGTYDTGSLGVTNGAAQTGASLITNGWAVSSTVLKKGDVFTLASVNRVTTRGKQDTGQLMTFVVTADVTSDGAGNATIGISPSITITGAYQNVTAAPATGVAINVQGAEGVVTPQNLVYHDDAFIFAGIELVVPEGTHKASAKTDNQLKIPMRMIWDYVVKDDEFICRTDVKYGWAVRPEFACRVEG